MLIRLMRLGGKGLVSHHALSQPKPGHDHMASYRIQVDFDGALQRFFNVSQTVGAMGPNAYVSEPQLTVNTLYPEDETLDLSALIEGNLKHPLLAY